RRSPRIFCQTDQTCRVSSPAGEIEENGARRGRFAPVFRPVSSGPTQLHRSHRKRGCFRPPWSTPGKNDSNGLSERLGALRAWGGGAASLRPQGESNMPVTTDLLPWIASCASPLRAALRWLPSRSSGGTAPARGRRLGVEQLEDRVTPAINWITTSPL